MLGLLILQKFSMRGTCLEVMYHVYWPLDAPCLEPNGIRVPGCGKRKPFGLTLANTLCWSHPGTNLQSAEPRMRVLHDKVYWLQFSLHLIPSPASDHHGPTIMQLHPKIFRDIQDI